MSRLRLDENYTHGTHVTKTGQTVAIEMSDDHPRAWIRLIDPDDPQPFEASCRIM